MSFSKRYFHDGEPNARFARDVIILLLAVLALATCWPLRSVPTGSRGVITVGGAIQDIQSEGSTLVAPWQRLAAFNIRAEQADVKNTQGTTSDTQPVKSGMTVRYSICPDKVAEVFEKYSHDGDLDSYITTATLEIFKAVTAKYTALDLFIKRSQVLADSSAQLRAKMAQYSAQIINIDMTQFW